MEVTIPARLRAAIYIIIVLGTSVIVPLNVAGIISDVAFSVWTSLAGAGSLLAALNIQKGAK